MAAVYYEFPLGAEEPKKVLGPTEHTFEAKTAEVDYFKMVSMGSRETGLPMSVYFSTAQGADGPFMKADSKYNCGREWTWPGTAFKVFFSRVSGVLKDVSGIGNISQEDVELVKDFIALNKAALCDLWEGKISKQELKDQILPASSTVAPVNPNKLSRTPSSAASESSVAVTNSKFCTSIPHVSSFSSMPSA